MAGEVEATKFVGEHRIANMHVSAMSRRRRLRRVSIGLVIPITRVTRCIGISSYFQQTGGGRQYYQWGSMRAELTAKKNSVIFGINGACSRGSCANTVGALT